MFDHRPGEAVDSEVDGCKILDVGVIGEDAEIGPRSQTAQSVDQFNVVGFQEDEIRRDFKGKRNGAHCLPISGEVSFLVFKDSFVSGCQLRLLCDLSQNRGTVLSILAA